MFEVLWPLIIFGLVMWLVDQYVPMEDNVKGVVRIGAGILAVGYLLQSLGVIPPLFH